MGLHLLSKSSYLKGIQCEKGLYLYKYHYEWADKLTESQQAVFRTGHDVGHLAQKLFPCGFDASVPYGDPSRIEKQVKLTKALIEEGHKVIYEASFLFAGVLVIADIMVRKGSKWKVYEVKSSTQIKEVNLPDAAVQYYVITSCGIDIADISIVHVNNNYCRQGEIDLQELFIIESMRDEVIEMMSTVKENIRRFKQLLAQQKVPEAGIGPHCSDPYDCSFRGYCWQSIPEQSVFNLGGMTVKKKFELYDGGIIKLEDIPDDYPLNDPQRLQVESYKNGTTYIDEEAVENFLESLTYPLYFLDFETFNPAVPLFDNSRPYQQIPFQYSLHYKETESSETVHYQFLAEAAGDPRIPFVENLLKDIGKKGDVVVYNQSFEAGRIKELAEDFPEYKKRLNNILSRFTDLMLLFRQKQYYTPEMNGSYSIKSVLPALVPEMSYSHLDIGEGGTASRAFESLYFEKDLKKITEVRKQLLEYCGTDTLAMVRIYEVLNK